MSDSHSVNVSHTFIENELFECRLFWARVINSETENLLTNFTKHTFWEIEYALEGRIGLTLDGDQPIWIEEGAFLIVPPDRYHQVTDADSAGKRFIMGFSVTARDDIVRQRIQQLTHPVVRPANENMRQLVALLMRQEHRWIPAARRSVEALAECFLLEILEAVDPDNPSDPAEAAQHRTFQQADARIRACNGIHLTVRELAEQVNMSQRQLSRIFRRELGKTPLEAINRARLARIEEMLSATRLSLTEISALCGFSDEYSMDRFFRRYNHVSLSAFRRIARK